jgi:hypothetical protein
MNPSFEMLPPPVFGGSIACMPQWNQPWYNLVRRRSTLGAKNAHAVRCSAAAFASALLRPRRSDQ